MVESETDGAGSRGAQEPQGGASSRRVTFSRRGVAVAVMVVILVVAAVLVARRSSGPSTGSDASGGPGTTEPAAAVTAPLTGLVDLSGAAATRCAVTVKIDNTREAQPQDGLEQADVVYEEVVEASITRLAAVFQSRAPDRVGPVRSVRRTDQSIVWPLRGVFAYSGGAPYAIDSINTAPVTQLDEPRAGPMMFRDLTRDAPHNLYARVDQMYSRCVDPPPPALFSYRPSQSHAAGDPATSVRVGFEEGYAVTWDWDTASGSWRRSIFGAPHVGASGDQLAATNVVVMSTSYAGGVGVEGAEAILTGQGFAWVFTEGRVVKGSWSRPDKAEAARLLDSTGQPIPLTPGSTWVELPDISYAVTITP